MDVKGDERDGDEGEEEESVYDNGRTACLKPTELNRFALSRQLKQNSRAQQYEKNHRHQHRSPVQPHFDLFVFLRLSLFSLYIYIYMYCFTYMFIYI